MYKEGIQKTEPGPSQWCPVGTTGESKWDWKRKFQAAYKENFCHYKGTQAVEQVAHELVESLCLEVFKTQLGKQP